mgnify:CR=1 FL=1
MLKIKFIYIIFFLTLFNNSFAEIVNKIKINGNKRVSPETIKVYGQIKQLNSDFTNSDINKILINLFQLIFRNLKINLKLDHKLQIYDLEYLQWELFQLPYL